MILQRKEHYLFLRIQRIAFSFFSFVEEVNDKHAVLEDAVQEILKREEEPKARL